MRVIVPEYLGWWKRAIQKTTGHSHHMNQPGSLESEKDPDKAKLRIEHALAHCAGYKVRALLAVNKMYVRD